MCSHALQNRPATSDKGLPGPHSRVLSRQLSMLACNCSGSDVRSGASSMKLSQLNLIRMNS